ncbi:MAG: Gfo/Idh/MocA family oxidoreductase [Clostridia bacterium]|nr:Gfo/Idh/MocA family oxidoreductase [Clostridia bacterium]
MAKSNNDARLDFNVASAAAEIDTSKKVRVGIIGTGWIAGPHVEIYKNMPDVEIVAGADLVPGKAESFFKGYGLENVKCYSNHKEMLDDDSLKLDAVSVCTYNTTHAECAIYALDKGINVLLEKPMCVTLEEAIEIRKAEKRSGKVLSIGFQPRFDPNMQMVKSVVQSGVLGKIYYIQTGGGRRRGIPTPFGTSFIAKETGGIGALGDIGCYSLDMLLNAIGYPKPLTVTGYTSAYFGTDPNYCSYVAQGHPEYAAAFGVDDFAAGFVRLEGDIIVDFRISWAMNMDTPGDALILGTKGGLRIPSTDCWNGTIGGPLKIYSEVGGEQVCTEIPMKESNVNCFEVKIRSFVDAVKYGGAAPVPSSEIIYNQAILSGIKKSADLGKEIEIEIPEI